MAPPSRFGWPSLAAFFLLFLSLLNIATAAPLPDDHVKKTLVARKTSITQERYEAYLTQYFPDTGHYLFYTGGSERQVEAFKAKNSGYYYYDDLFNAHNDDHPWYEAFNEDNDEDDGEASSKAMAAKASGEVLVFGGIEYKGQNSFFTRQEIDILHKGIQDGRINSINHMAKGATDPSQVMAKEDANGVFTWQDGYKEGDKNAGNGSDVVDDSDSDAEDALDDAEDALDDWTR
ncbi:hypothetical protein K458DRAFT_323889 [Lentithecium fluviatile CBS 122367]|uniref:Uncharacterized protein n=1 Tax=Lentithecium fluviatile CBS 122367 TaxID=1168545 RepID=A0A6G1IBZ9_9PLEO|nr:hypothetical protein K458DRAFT_323889 [Lentithecium fluviatile CBS 122367]